jgi:hypothetical protein
MLQFPVATMIRFCHNHGLIQVTNRPQWWTVAGGARQYVQKIVAGIDDKRLNTPVQHIVRDAQGVTIHSQGQAERFDKVVLACHSDQSLALLGDATAAERGVFGRDSIPTQPRGIAYRHVSTASRTQRLGGMELPAIDPNSQRRRAGLPALPDQPVTTCAV